MSDMQARFQDLKACYEHMQRRSEAPSLTQWLPYREYDAQLALYFNTRNIGFSKVLEPLAGANDQLVDSLNKILCELPDGESWDYQFVMLGTHQVDDYLAQNRDKASLRGGINAALAQKEYQFAQYGAKYGFPTKKGNSIRMDLKHYRCALFVSSSSATVQEMVDVREVLDSKLSGADVHSRPMTPDEFITHVSQTLNFNPHNTSLKGKTYQPLESIHEQILAPASEFLTRPDGIAYRTSEGEQDIDGVIVTYTLSKLPREFRLYGFPEVLASLAGSKSLKCPFRVSCNVHVHDKGRAKIRNQKKLNAAKKWGNSPMAMFMPNVAEEIAERKHIADAFEQDIGGLAGMVFTVTLFTNEEDRRRDMTAAEQSFEKAGLDIETIRHLQLPSLLASLPFCLAGGMFSDLKKLGRVRTLKTNNAVNFLPIVSGRRDLGAGLLLPTTRNQVNFMNLFACGSDNYNGAVAAGSGSGKSFAMQNIAKSVFECGGRVWVIDKGDSYKKVTQFFGGTYMNAKDIRLNPFSHLTRLEEKSRGNKESQEDPLALAINDITALIAAMAAPNSDLEDFQLRAISKAIMNAYRAHQDKANIDNVRDELNAIAKERNDDQRISDLAFQLDVMYCTDGMFGKIFNEPSMLDPDCDFTTLELDGFNDDVLRPVVFALMVNINQAMYLSGDRSTPKMCIIEEAWKLMAGSNKQSKAFIENGYRTARKFGGSFVSVTQSLYDYFLSEEALVAYNNSDIKFYLRQGEDFDKFVSEYPTALSPFEISMIKSFEPAKRLGYSNLMIKAGGQTSFHRLFAHPWARTLFSTEPSEFEYVEKKMAEGQDLEQAVTSAAWHFFPDEMGLFEAQPTEASQS